MFFRILILLTIISNTTFGQIDLNTKEKAFVFIDTLITKDKLTVEFLDIVYPQDVQEILLRMQNAMAEKKEWSEEFFSKNYKPGEGLPYHENLGITKDEFKKIKNLDKTPLTVVVKNTSAINKIREDNILKFIADEENAQLFDFLEIDLEKELVIFNNDTIPYYNEINAPSTTPFGEWHGYSWKKEVSNLEENDDLKIDSLVSKIIEIDIGRIKQNNKTLFRLIYKDVDKGKVNANVDVACYID